MKISKLKSLEIVSIYSLFEIGMKLWRQIKRFMLLLEVENLKEAKNENIKKRSKDHLINKIEKKLNNTIRLKNIFF